MDLVVARQIATRFLKIFGELPPGSGSATVIEWHVIFENEMTNRNWCRRLLIIAARYNTEDDTLYMPPTVWNGYFDWLADEDGNVTSAFSEFVEFVAEEL